MNLKDSGDKLSYNLPLYKGALTLCVVYDVNSHHFTMSSTDYKE